jgi:NADH-quinone oxidoreductase subunit C
MTPHGTVDRPALAARLAAVLPGAALTDAYGVLTADVGREQWAESVTAVRDDDVLDGRFFDVLLAVDEHPAGFDVVVRLWSVARRHGIHLRTRCPRDDPRVPSLTAVFAGAAWHEREAAEMFGLRFDGHPSLTPLLLAAGSDAPLRKERVLAARTAEWPGAVDPTDTGPGGSTGRRRLQPPGSPPPLPPGDPL